MGTANVYHPTLLWDAGSAYEFFISLVVLHEPDTYGVRASWAAGVRSRIPAAERRLLEEVMPFMPWPLAWIHERLPAPKDAISVFWALRQLPPVERITTLLAMDCCEADDAYFAVLKRVMQRRKWDEQDIDDVLKLINKKGKEGFDRKKFSRFLDWCARPEEFGEGFLAGLQAYYQSFFEEEEKRITPILRTGLESAQQKARQLGVDDLLVELSQGVRFVEKVEASEILMIPVFWTTPLALYEKLSSERAVFLFGVRPAEMSAIPGEMVPEGLLRTLKAMADPTRLKILYYLSNEELTPSELARRLHLRAPTVTHHLSELRLAGLVNLTIRGQEKLYTIRSEALDTTFSGLDIFLNNAPEALMEKLSSSDQPLADVEPTFDTPDAPIPVTNGFTPISTERLKTNFITHPGLAI